MQRTLASKNISHAKRGALLAGRKGVQSCLQNPCPGTLKFLPLFLLVLPGMAARVLYKYIAVIITGLTLYTFLAHSESVLEIFIIFTQFPTDPQE